MADDGTDAWEHNEAGLQNLIDNYDTIQRNALQAAADAVAPRLIDAAPRRVDEKRGGNSLPEYALKGAVRARVALDKITGKLQAVIDFGKLTWLAHIVDIGHNPPHSVLAIKLGHEITGKPTPAHPFVRAVQDSQQKTAQAAYTAAMTEGMTRALKGMK